MKRKRPSWGQGVAIAALVALVIGLWFASYGAYSQGAAETARNYRGLKAELAAYGMRVNDTDVTNAIPAGSPVAYGASSVGDFVAGSRVLNQSVVYSFSRLDGYAGVEAVQVTYWCPSALEAALHQCQVSGMTAVRYQLPPASTNWGLYVWAAIAMTILAVFVTLHGFGVPLRESLRNMSVD